ncbi:YveK family protein [uncultured Flavonifractor sp.]|uniref:YveK family protein n=1 Tax=uncultured Flavonifractor sp. TaxID=1193534 RepID=UPI00262DA3BF|nr:Wzz/FepE/Etk N-terminal domain-containing protein [uncultured Flavonifractor sp.]
MTEKRNDGVEIDLGKLLRLYLHYWWVIVLSVLVVGGGALLFTANCITPLYKAEVTVYVSNSNVGQQQSDYLTSSNLTASQQLVSTYINIIRSNTVLEKVAASADLDITADEIREMMSTAQVDDTEFFNIFITHPDPEIAAYLANTIAEVAPGEITSFIEGSSTKIVDFAKVPTKPSSPSVLKNTLVGILLGGFLSVAFLTVRDLLDVRVKNEEDLMEISSLPVLGRIPVFTQEKKQNRYASGRSAADGGRKGGHGA